MSDSEDEVSEKHIKIVFVGDSSVGKSSLIRRFCFNEYSRHYNGTVGADFYRKHIVLQETHNVVLKITDIGGQELKGAMLDKYLYKSDIIILVYDITNTASFDIMSEWIRTLNKMGFYPPVNAIFGNKSDLEHRRTVRLDKTEEFVQDHRIQNYSVSARTGENVFTSILDLVCKHLGISMNKVQKDIQKCTIKSLHDISHHSTEVTPKQKSPMPSSSSSKSSRLKSPVCILQ